MKDKCTLTDEELIEKAKDWVLKLCNTGGKDWSLRVPVDFNHDPDIIFTELCNRLEKAYQPDERTFSLKEMSEIWHAGAEYGMDIMESSDEAKQRYFKDKFGIEV